MKVVTTNNTWRKAVAQRVAFAHETQFARVKSDSSLKSNKDIYSTLDCGLKIKIATKIPRETFVCLGLPRIATRLKLGPSMEPTFSSTCPPTRLAELQDLPRFEPSKQKAT